MRWFRKLNTKEVKNVVASVLARLHNTSKSNGVPFQQALQQYAMERFLYRVSKSRHAQSVTFKNALLLKTIGIPNARPTMDIDMLRKGKADQGNLAALDLTRLCSYMHRRVRSNPPPRSLLRDRIHKDNKATVDTGANSKIQLVLTDSCTERRQSGHLLPISSSGRTSAVRKTQADGVGIALGIDR